MANGAPVIFGGGAPIDGRGRFRGKPIFGKHKTVRGFVFGVASGIVIGALLSLAFPQMLIIGIALSFGTLIGDMIGSFIKRQTGHKEGKDVFLMDQYAFLVVALLFALPFGYLPGMSFLWVNFYCNTHWSAAQSNQLPGAQGEDKGSAVVKRANPELYL